MLLAHMLTLMDSWSSVVRAERKKLGLSTRELGRLAGVSYPTISRIENGHEQPRLDTLAKLLEALGKTLLTSLEPAPVPRLARLADAWTRDAFGDELPDWTRWRGFVDQLRLHREVTAVAISEAPLPSGSELIDNLLAATAEKLADDARIRRPAWTGSVPPPRTHWSAPATRRKQAANVAETPGQFAARNITLPVSALWRDREMVRS
jgi:transcriptional regulator with XRE-family HTH domain